MKLLIMNSVQSTIKESNAVPRIGEKIDLFYMPLPTVFAVVWFPSKETLKTIKMENNNIDVIIYVS